MEKQIKQCQNCKSEFIIEPADFEFYEKIKVPAPTWCPECRTIRRLSWRNERALYRRKCDLCNKNIIAMYPSDTIFPVYCNQCWNSDKWDGTNFGKDHDFTKSFFENFKELQKLVPRISLQASNMVNSDFANQVANCKNCYLITSGTDNEDSYYTHRIHNSKDIFDSFFVLKSENCYEVAECFNSNNIKFSQNCSDSMDLQFCYDARSSQNCFMSSNLRRASNVFQDEAISKEDYNEKISNIDTGSYKNLQKYKLSFEELLGKSIRKFADYKNAVNFIGNGANNVKDCRYCFNVSNNENCANCLFVNDAKDSYDINNGCCVMELNYEVSTMGVNAYNIIFSVDAWPEIRDSAYCDSCRNGSNNLFGCIGLCNKQYCILNKQYTKEEYEELVPKIIEHMG